MATFSRRVILFPYPKSEAEKGKPGERGDIMDAEVKVGRWTQKHTKRSFWHFFVCGKQPAELPAAYCFSDDAKLPDELGQLTDEYA